MCFRIGLFLSTFVCLVLWFYHYKAWDKGKTKIKLVNQIQAQNNTYTPDLSTLYKVFLHIDTVVFIRITKHAWLKNTNCKYNLSDILRFTYIQKENGKFEYKNKILGYL